MTTLRPRQQKMLRFIEQFMDERGYPPTVRDIQSGCDISSTSVVDYNLRALTRAGLLKRSREVSRGIELVGRRQRTARVPLLGSIAAGEPIPVFPADPAMLEDEDTVEVDAELVRDNARLYALQVKGNSMIDALIRDGDVVILEAQEHAETGEMVAAWLVDSEETTLKRFYAEGPRVRLQPENMTMGPIYADARNVQIKGRVVGVIRRYE
jgi:repressor LexA